MYSSRHGRRPQSERLGRHPGPAPLNPVSFTPQFVGVSPPQDPTSASKVAQRTCFCSSTMAWTVCGVQTKTTSFSTIRNGLSHGAHDTTSIPVTLTSSYENGRLYNLPVNFDLGVPGPHSRSEGPGPTVRPSCIVRMRASFFRGPHDRLSHEHSSPGRVFPSLGPTSTNPAVPPAFAVTSAWRHHASDRRMSHSDCVANIDDRILTHRHLHFTYCLYKRIAEGGDTIGEVFWATAQHGRHWHESLIICMSIQTLPVAVFAHTQYSALRCDEHEIDYLAEDPALWLSAARVGSARSEPSSWTVSVRPVASPCSKCLPC